MKTIAIALFVLMYVGMIAFGKYRHFIALGTAVLYVVLGILPFSGILSALDWNVLFMLTGTMLLVDYFIESGMPDRIANALMKKAPNLLWLTIFMSLFAGIISAFIDNVSTVLMVAPIGIAICKELKISPVNMIIAIAVSSNLQGAATLVGDTTSIMLGAANNMDFMDFFVRNGRPGMFFATELGALCTIPIMMVLFRRDKQPITAPPAPAVKDFLPTVMLLLMIATLIAASFIPEKPSVTNGVICTAFALVTAFLEVVLQKNKEGFTHALKALDTDTLLLLAGLFLVIGGVTEIGLIDDLAALITSVGGGNLFLLYTVIVWGSVVISAFIDNIPYVATMLPVLSGVAASMGAPKDLLFFGLLVGATLGGNITPIGASANIAGIGMLRKEGYEVSFPTFMRIGVPFTLVAVLAGYLFVWVFFRG